MFKWDSYSDQPYPIRDKKYRKEIGKKALFDIVKVSLISLFMLPLIALRFIFELLKRREPTSVDIFGMGITNGCSKELVDELGVKKLLLRVPLSDIDNLDSYKSCIDKFKKDYKIVVNILQDRDHIEDNNLLKNSIDLIFSTLDIDLYQVGNAINRKKWAFFTMDEYMRFYKTVEEIRDKRYPHIKLIGSSVIDFEYHYTIRTLFNLYPIKYDKFSSLLYVDRRGDPQNSQMGLDLIKKIKLLFSIVSISSKSSNKIVITETNWPISKTAPYAPTSERECVNLDDYALFMVKYHLLSIATSLIDTIYWHQLIAPGYGLIDNREGIKKYPSFYAYKTMVKLLSGALLKEYKLNKKDAYFYFQKEKKSIKIYWSDRDLEFQKGLDLYGKEFKKGDFIYIVDFDIDS